MAVWYLATDGSDGGGGGIGNPWRTFDYAGPRLSAADTLYVRGGTYDEGINGNLFPSGTSWANPTRIAAYPGETVIIAPTVAGNAAGGFWLLLFGNHLGGSPISPQYVELEGITFEQTDLSFGGLYFVLQDANRIRLRSCHIQSLYSATGDTSGGNVALNGDYCEFLDCEVDGHRGYGFYIQGSYNLVERCDIHDNAAVGIQIYRNSGTPPWPQGNVIRNNRIHDQWGINELFGNPDHRIGGIVSNYNNNQIYNNLLYNIRSTDPTPEPYGAIQLYNDGDNQKVFNNSIFNCDGDAIYIASLQTNAQIKNNIGFGCDNNGINDNGTGTVDANNLWTDPDFTDAPNGDLTLQASSDAIDAGADLSAFFSTDFAGGLRPFGDDWDIGAYEYGSTPGAGGEGGPGPGDGDEEEGGGDGPTDPDAGGDPGGGDIDEGGVGAPAVTGSVVDSYSDQDMQCPASWENGFKEGLITRWGDAERPASHLFSGEWQGSTFSFQIADKQGRFRAQAASFTERYWNDALTIRMTTRANRALYGQAFTVFCGPIIDAQPTTPLLWDITLGDVVSQTLLSDRALVPWRVVRDGFLHLLDSISESLDLDQPEPILYGPHNRIGNVSPAPEAGWRIAPIYLGIELLNEVDPFHCWLVCGHAVSSLTMYVDDEETDEDPLFGITRWIIPHQAHWTTLFGAPYVDKESITGGDRRYTLIYGRFGQTNPDACATGEKTLTVALDGVEESGNGIGAPITDRFQQYKHFLVNYVANSGPNSYQSGAWLANPTWDLFDGPVFKVDEESFDTASGIALTRLILGYPGSAAIGLGPGQRKGAKALIADWNRSCGCRFGISHNGEMRIFLLHPTEAIKAAAPLYTDAYEILDGSFSTEIRWDEHATSIPYRADFHEPSGEWTTSDVVRSATQITNYQRDIPSEIREYPFAPGEAQASHLATLELRIRKHRPRYVRFEATIGPDPVSEDSIAYRDIGDYIRYECFDAVQESREIRLAQVISTVVRVGARTAGVIAMDVEDLIDYDTESSPEVDA